mmetsp:Transcript_20761/g.57391  ORF Transcript_20761/g.57391 Transcript_20761/m.57391 type:complete len:209 (-) Transcript_20761:1559-2185(-)
MTSADLTTKASTAKPVGFSSPIISLAASTAIPVSLKPPPSTGSIIFSNTMLLTAPTNMFSSTKVANSTTILTFKPCLPNMAMTFAPLVPIPPTRMAPSNVLISPWLTLFVPCSSAPISMQNSGRMLSTTIFGSPTPCLPAIKLNLRLNLPPTNKMTSLACARSAVASGSALLAAALPSSAPTPAKASSLVSSPILPTTSFGMTSKPPV